MQVNKFSFIHEVYKVKTFGTTQSYFVSSPYHEALNNLKYLFGKIDSFEAVVRRRLMKIEELWPKLSAFYLFDNAPSTNNSLENYHSVSLMTHRMNQLKKTDIEY